jgi:hypothetical protein
LLLTKLDQDLRTLSIQMQYLGILFWWEFRFYGICVHTLMMQ